MDERATLRAFDGLADTYARHRPSYPMAAIERLLEGIPPPVAAVDIGCGTGISARLLAAAGAAVIGVDPSPDMLRAAAAESPASIRWLQATAEATGLPDRSADVVLAAQAFHWFDAARALDEFARLLVPGGRAAILFNVRLAGRGFTDAYDRIVVASAERLDPSVRSARESLDAPLWSSPRFTDVRTFTFPNPQRLDETGVIGRATSASYFPRAEPERSARIAALRTAFAENAIDGHVELAQETRLTVARRR